MKFLRKLLVTLLMFNSVSIFAAEKYLQSIDSEFHKQFEKKGIPSDKEHLNEYNVQINKILKGINPFWDKEGKKDKAKNFLNSFLFSHLAVPCCPCPITSGVFNLSVIFTTPLSKTFLLPNPKRIIIVVSISI